MRIVSAVILLVVLPVVVMAQEVQAPASIMVPASGEFVASPLDSELTNLFAVVTLPLEQPREHFTQSPLVSGYFVSRLNFGGQVIIAFRDSVTGEILTLEKVQVRLDDTKIQITRSKVFDFFVCHEAPVDAEFSAFVPGQNLVVFYEGKPVLGNPNPNDPRGRITIPPHGQGFWAVIDVSQIATLKPPTITPTKLIGQSAQKVVATYTDIVPRGEMGYSHSFSVTGAQGIGMPFLAVVLDAKGNPDPTATISVVRSDSAGNLVKTLVPNVHDGAICLNAPLADQFLALYVNGREIKHTVDNAEGLLPWHTRTGFGALVFVRSGG